MIPGTFVPSSGGGGVAFEAPTYVDIDIDTSGASSGATINFTIDLGDASPKRITAIILHADRADGFASATIGGLTATEQQHSKEGSWTSAQVFTADTSGLGDTSITVAAVVGSSSLGRSACASFRLVADSETPASTPRDQTGSGSNSVSFTIPAGGGGIAGVTIDGTSAQSWSGASESYDSNFSSSRASGAVVSASGTVSSSGGGDDQCLVGAVWGP